MARARRPAGTRRVPTAGALLALSAACGGGPSAPAPERTPRPLAVAAVRDLGPVVAPPSVTARDGGATGLLAGRVLWTFGDTLFSPRSVDGANLRSSTAALADPASPTAVREPVDANGAPFAFLPLTAEEQAYNDASGRPDERVALWPSSLVNDADGSGGALVFYLKLVVHPGTLNYEYLGTGVARVAPGATAAVRDPELLFRSPEPRFDDALLAGGMVYVYGNLPEGSREQAVGVARAPQALVRDRRAYRFWDGSGWVAEAARAGPILRGVPGDLTVSYNAYLGRYLAVHSAVLSNAVVLQAADRPEGPWSEPVVAFTGLVPAAGAVDYAGREHPELSADGGRRLFVSYYHPLGQLRGELRLVELTLE